MQENTIRIEQLDRVEQVVEKLGQIIITLQTQVERHEETIKSLSKWLTHAFREMGYDFAKIAQIESSRHRDEIQAQVDVPMEPEEMDPAVQDEIARKVLASSLPSFQTTKQIRTISPRPGSVLIPEETGGDLQNDVAQKILKLKQDSRALVNEASNKGRKE